MNARPEPRPAETAPDRPPLPALPPLLLREGPLPRPCVVEELREGLILRPTGGLQRLRGEAPVLLPLDEIAELHIQGDELLSLRVGSRTLRLEGPGAGALGAWLDQALHGTATEVAVMEGSAWIIDQQRSLAPVRLLPGRLELSAGGGLITLPLAQIDALSLIGLEQDLVIEAKGRTLRLAGGISPLLYQALHRLRFGADPLDCPRLARWPARLRVGPPPEGAPALDGVIELFADQLVFVDGGSGERTPLRLSAVERLVVWGRPVPQLGVVTAHRGGGRLIWNLELDDPRAALEALSLVIHKAQRLFSADAARRQANIDAVMQRWGRHVEVAEGAHTLKALALRVLPLDVSVGVVCLVRDRLWFLPCGGPTGTTGADTWGCSELVRDHSEDAVTPGSVRFTAQGRRYRIVPAADEVFAGRFWDRCRAPARILREPTAVLGTLDRICGQPRLLRVRGPDGTSSTAQPGFCARMEPGVGVFVDDELSAVAHGDLLTVEVGRPDGIYQFEARALEQRMVSPRAQESAGMPPSAAPRRLLLLTAPRELRLYNQRRSFRVSVDIEAHAWVQGPMAARLPLHIDDLSTGGCAAWAPAPLEIGAQVDIQLALPERGLRATARVLRADRTDPAAPHRQRYGLRFEGLSPGDEDRIQRVVLAQQAAAQRDALGA
jgi:c-di-GMP-binding flagellar brake protein YcgR